jgi:D-erythro-7,8-dihydroneopterin triphosphate epimerase
MLTAGGISKVVSMKTDAKHIPDKIRIRDLKLSCIVGINENERIVPQEIVINICLEADLRVPCASDRIEDTIDYKVLKKEIIAMVKDSSFFLIERLAEEVSRICLTRDLVRRVTVIIDKPHALTYARSVSVEITREKDGR